MFYVSVTPKQVMRHSNMYSEFSLGRKARIDLPPVLPVIRLLPEVWRVLCDAVVVVLTATVGIAKELVRLRKKGYFSRQNLADVFQFQYSTDNNAWSQKVRVLFTLSY